MVHLSHLHLLISDLQWFSCLFLLIILVIQLQVMFLRVFLSVYFHVPWLSINSFLVPLKRLVLHKSAVHSIPVQMLLFPAPIHCCMSLNQVSQLHIVLPTISPSSSSSSVNAVPSQGIQTRLRTSTVTRKDYSTLTAILSTIINSC